VKVQELTYKVYDALGFIFRSFAIPRRVILEAAEAATKVITECLRESSGGAGK